MKKLMNISPITCESHAQILKKSACKSTNKCRKCGKSHHTLLHFVTPSEANSSIPRDANNAVLSASAKVFHPVVFDATNADTGPNPPDVNNPSITSCSGFDSNSQVLLCTALVNVCDSFGGTQLCHVLLDPGSQTCLITNSCLGRLVDCLGSEQMYAFHDFEHQILELMVPEASLLISEEKAREEHFIDTHVRNEDGRYVVRLPFHSSPSKLGDSRESAIRRFKSLERSLIKQSAIYSQYRDFMKEYLTLGHMELVFKNDYAKKEAYYLPLHAVLRDSRTTTKLRVVFNASAKLTSGTLNDLLMVIFRVQRDVSPILFSFRTFQIAVCADLEMMFRQVRILSEDTNWQRILWRDNPKEPAKKYRLTTVTYGTSCEP
ncbi:DUF1758 domain-containing protein [Trichonephila clavata]|uniref:DUF1758 domain-containing protein n=1 Tax=Trichonephila clavata TaxID=2740835 RepID=A0A8X6LHS9_TRICU|nr:DUF1758 domain-containing protein [Trichonephila clavata]